MSGVEYHVPVTGVDPVNAQHLATKNYVDALANGAEWKQQCRLATAVALPTNVYSNGSSGVGATLTGTAFGALTIDGVTPAVGNRVLVKNEAAPANNGIYIVSTVGAIATLYVLTRATDYNQSAEVAAGTATFVTEGTANADTAWVQTTTGTITMGSTSLVFVQFGSGGAPSGSAGGDLGSTYPNPTVAAIHETTGPTKLTIGSIPDGDYLVRSGSTLIGGSPTPGGPPTGAAGGDLNGTYPNPGVSKVLGVSAIGIPVLVYRYTVTGSDKASIDTGVDTPDAGSNDWTNGDLLEVFLYARTDEAVVPSPVFGVWNNDTAGHYDYGFLRAINTTVSAFNNVADTVFEIFVPGASAAASVFGAATVVMPNFAGTVGNKAYTFGYGVPSQTAASFQHGYMAGGFRSTAAVTRLSFAPGTAAKKFKVGTQLLIYKRLAS